MKKALALILACVLLLGVIPAMAEYDEHYDYTATYVDRGSTEIDDMYRYFCDKFNIDIEMIGIPWSAMADTNSVMIMGQTMYDWMMISFDVNTYNSYVEQGLLAALPEGFEEKYPNIVHAMDASGIKEYLYAEDGLVYGIPMPILFNFAPQSYYLNMQAIFYRADWAKELGFDFGASVKLSEFKEFLKACIEKDMAGNGQTIGYSSSGVASSIMNLFNDSYANFAQVDGQYVWGPTMAGTVDGIKEAKAMYNEGLCDLDFYALDSFGGQNKLAAGLCAAARATGTTTNYQIILDAATAAGLENASSKIKPIMLTDEDGVWYGGEVKNYWMINVFNPEIEPEKLERLLDLIDYLCTVECEEIINMGFKGVDWDVDENGYYVSLLDPEVYSNVRQKYPSGWFWRDTAFCLDEFDLVNPTYTKEVLDNTNAVYDYRYASAEANGYTKLDNNVTFLTTDAKKNYSVDIDTEMVRIVCDGNISMDAVEAEWQKFIDANKPIWQPVVDDLNALIAK